MNLTLEKESEFSAQDRYDIINAAILDSYDDGFMNAFVCGRALYCYIYATLIADDLDQKQELFITIHANPLSYWDEHLDEIEQMLEEHQQTIELISSETSTWFTDYTEYAYSTRGMLDNLGDILTGVTQRAEDELIAMQNNGELQSVIDIADSWGLNREDNKAVVKTEAKIIDAESLF